MPSRHGVPARALCAALLTAGAMASCSLPTDLPPGSATVSGRVRLLATLSDAAGFSAGTRRIEDPDSLRVYLVHSGTRYDSTRTVAGVYRFPRLRSGTFLTVLDVIGVPADTSQSIIVPAADVAVPDTLVLTRIGDLGSRPNPFSSATILSYGLTADSDVSLQVLTLAGSPVRTLASGPQPAGLHDVTWDGRNDAAQVVPNGRYVAILAAGAERRAEILLKEP